MQRKLSQLHTMLGNNNPDKLYFYHSKPGLAASWLGWNVLNWAVRQFSKVSDLNGPITRAAQEGKNEVGTGISTNSIAGLQDMDTRKLISTFIWNYLLILLLKQPLSPNDGWLGKVLRNVPFIFWFARKTFPHSLVSTRPHC